MKHVLVAVAALAFAGVVTTPSAAHAARICKANLNWRGDAAVQAIQSACQAGDTILFRRSSDMRCSGAHCTTDSSIETLCDPADPVVMGAYNTVSCTYGGPPTVQ